MRQTRTIVIPYHRHKTSPFEDWLLFNSYEFEEGEMNETETNLVSEELNCSALLLYNNTVCIDDPEEMLKPWKTNPLFFEIIVVHLTTFIFGFCGNIIVISVLSYSRKSRTATNSFLISLAVGDLLMLCVYGPLETYTHFVLEWDENGTICKTAKFSEFLSATSSVLNLLAVTIERFLVIVFPMKSRTLCTNSNTVKGIMGVWVFSILLASPILLTTGTYKIVVTNRVLSIVLNYCNHSIDSPIFVIYQFFIIFFIPGVIMIVCYAMVIKELWASTQKMDMMSNGGRKRNRIRFVISNNDEINAARKQVIKMLMLVVALFYVSWGPRLTMELLQKFHMIPFTQNAYLLRIILNLLTFFHGCINPFIYSFMSRNFQNSLQQRLDRWSCKRTSQWLGSKTRPPKSRPYSQNLSVKRRKNFETGESKYSQFSFTSNETRSTELESIPLSTGGDLTDPTKNPDSV